MGLRDENPVSIRLSYGMAFRSYYKRKNGKIWLQSAQEYMTDWLARELKIIFFTWNVIYNGMSNLFNHDGHKSGYKLAAVTHSIVKRTAATTLNT
jgi:hypothetical protein